MELVEINKLENSDFNKQVIFAYITCERLYPNYVYFSNNFEFGNHEVLRKAIDYIYVNLFELHFKKNDINSIINQIDKNTPDPSDFDTVLASSALDSCTVITETLNFLLDKNFSHIRDVSIMATDTADMYIQELENLDYNTDSMFQNKIESHPIMIKEITTQKGIINFLIQRTKIDFEDISTLLALQENSEKGSLGL